MEEFDIINNFYTSYPIDQAFDENLRYYPTILSRIKRDSVAKNIDNSMVEDGVFYLSSDNLGRKFYLDTYSGLIFIIDTDDTCSVSTFPHRSWQHDIFEAAFLRYCIQNTEFGNRMKSRPNFSDMTALNYMGYEVRNLFRTPILEYAVFSKKELEEIICDLTSILSGNIYFERLWFRGQRREYVISRSEKTLKKLNFPSEYQTMPSLLPSLARQIKTAEDYRNISMSKMRWIAAFGVWLMSQSKGFPFFNIGEPAYYEILNNLEFENLCKIIDDCPYDISEYVGNVDNQHNKAYILATQQYGGLTTMLDVTNDLDVALFFTQSKLNTETNRFELCDPSPENVIYIMAQCRDSSTYDVSHNLFKQLALPFGENFPVPPRINNQNCGLLFGANIFGINTYSYRIIAKIRIKSSEIYTTKGSVKSYAQI